MGKSSSESKEKIEELVRLVQEGDQESFAVLYDIFIDDIYRYVFYRVKTSDAEDLVENVFLKVWENIRKYKSGKSSFSAWIFRIAHNLIVDYYRTSKDRNFDELKIDIPAYKREHNPIKSVERIFDHEALKQALGKLKKEYQEIIVHKFVNEFSNSEVAQILNKSEGSLRILQYRALKALKIELENLGIKYNF